MTGSCAKCGHPKSEHAYNGACYGLCGEFEEPMPAIDTEQSLHDLEAAYRSICIHNERLREALLPCLGWLEYAYSNVDSVTATAVKAHLPAIRAAISSGQRHD